VNIVRHVETTSSPRCYLTYVRVTLSCDVFQCSALVWDSIACYLFTDVVFKPWLVPVLFNVMLTKCGMRLFVFSFINFLNAITVLFVFISWAAVSLMAFSIISSFSFSFNGRPLWYLSFLSCLISSSISSVKECLILSSFSSSWINLVNWFG